MKFGNAAEWMFNMAADMEDTQTVRSKFLLNTV